MQIENITTSFALVKRVVTPYLSHPLMLSCSETLLRSFVHHFIYTGPSELGVVGTCIQAEADRDTPGVVLSVVKRVLHGVTSPFFYV